MSRSFDPRVITLLAVVAAAMPIESLILSPSILGKSYCVILVILIAIQWRSSRRLLKAIEAVQVSDIARDTDTAKLWTMAGRVSAAGFMLILLSWVTAFFVFTQHRH